MHRTPSGVGGDDVGVAGVLLPCNQVACRDNRTVGEGTEALLEEGVEPPQVLQKSDGKVRDQAVSPGSGGGYGFTPSKSIRPAPYKQQVH